MHDSEPVGGSALAGERYAIVKLIGVSALTAANFELY